MSAHILEALGHVQRCSNDLRSRCVFSVAAWVGGIHSPSLADAWTNETMPGATAAKALIVFLAATATLTLFLALKNLNTTKLPDASIPGRSIEDRTSEQHVAMNETTLLGSQTRRESREALGGLSWALASTALPLDWSSVLETHGDSSRPPTRTAAGLVDTSVATRHKRFKNTAFPQNVALHRMIKVATRARRLPGRKRTQWCNKRTPSTQRSYA